MEKTKCDLSYDETKLDFCALLKCAAIAYGSNRRHVEEELNELQHLLKQEEYENAHFPLLAKRLADDSENLALASEVYYTLLNAKKRSKISIVNKPEINDKEVA